MRLRALVGVACAIVLGIGGASASAASTELFFSEYVEGSSNNKALEIYNGTGAPIDLAAGGYSVQMCFNGNPTCTLTINLTGTVAAILAQADQTNGAGWFNGDDAVLLRKGTEAIDSLGQVGFDPGTEWGAGPTSTADNTLRRRAGVEAGDTTTGDAFDPSLQWDGYATDTFGGLGVHTTGGDAPPFVASTTPAAGAVGVALDANVSITFSEDVSVSGAWFSISCATSGAHTALASGGPSTFTLDPDTDFAEGESCTVTVVGSQVADADLDDPPNTMAADASFSFTTFEPPPTIAEIQGAGHVSPYVNTAVSGVEGIVTARRGGSQGGLWIQDPAPDASPLTAEGIFVRFGGFPPSALAVGTRISVAGIVREFRGG
ncbi:MAG TPA: Ig-like domain-containing protein, partial [Gaiellaceae bacterium]|nr:Ig-like domain-containing protein [Gaiellaceae bacterium]